MNGQDLYEGLRYVDPTLLEEAMEPVKRPKWRRYLPVAACLCLLLAGTAAAVLHSVEIRILDVEHLEDYRDADPTLKSIQNGSADQAYQAAAEVEITPLASLSQQIREDAAAGRRSHKFDSWDEATEYLGVDLPGPEGPTDLYFKLEEGQISEIRLSVHNTYEGEWHAGIGVKAYLYTEYYSGEPGEFVLFHGDFEEIQAEELTLSNGDTAQLVPVFGSNGFGAVMAFMARGQGFYIADAVCPEEYEQQATEEVIRLLSGI